MSRVIQPTLEECRRFGLRRGDVIGGHEVLPPIAGGSDFRLSDGMDYEDVGQVLSAATGGTVVTAGNSNAKGAYVQLVGSTSRAATGLFVNCWQRSATAGGPYLVDIAVGAAASEQVVIPNLLYDVLGSSSTATGGLTGVFIPLAIPAGSRVSARAQKPRTSGTNSVQVACTLVEEGLGSPSGFSRITDYGTVTASSTGTAVAGPTTGNPNTKGAWTQIVSPTTNPCTMLIVIFYLESLTAPTNGLLDVGVGVGGSEVVVAGDLPTQPTNATDYQATAYLIPAQIPSGSRIAMRWQSSAAALTGRSIVYGID